MQFFLAERAAELCSLLSELKPCAIARVLGLILSVRVDINDTAVDDLSVGF